MNLLHKSLSLPEQESLVSWLNLPQFDTLIKVLESKVFELQSISANELLESATHSREQMKGAAMNKIDEAANVARAINLLQKMRDDKKDFTVFTAEPSQQPR